MSVITIAVTVTTNATTDAGFQAGLYEVFGAIDTGTALDAIVQQPKNYLDNGTEFTLTFSAFASEANAAFVWMNNSGVLNCDTDNWTLGTEESVFYGTVSRAMWDEAASDTTAHADSNTNRVWGAIGVEVAVGQSGIPLDAAIVTVVTDSFPAAATIKATQAGSFAANAVLLRAQAGSTTADAVIERTQSWSFATDATILRSQPGSTTADAVLLRTQAGSATADAVLLRGQSGSATVDAVILGTETGSISASAWIALRCFT